LNQKCNNDKNCDFTFYGLGVEKIFEEVQSIFPDEKMQIFSSDTINNNKDSENIINDIEKNKIPILVGTQLISKGFHFPSLNCIVVVNSDTNFLGSDIRASEKNFSIIATTFRKSGKRREQGNSFFANKRFKK
jgi:Primosomal protein N'' (replication factor Y) - superfamily II helicase